MSPPVSASVDAPPVVEAGCAPQPPPTWRCRLRALAAGPYALLTVVLALVMWPAWVTRDAVIVGGDAVLAHYPWFVLWRDLLAAGEPPFWNPYSFSGIPALPTLQAGFGYPPHWLLTPLPPIVAMNWLLGLHVVLAGLGAAWCAGRIGARRDGQVLAGLASALGSATVARLWAGHFSFVETNAWLPFATGFAAQIGRRNAVSWLALTVGMMALAGQPEIVIFSSWWLPLWALVGAWGGDRRALLRAILRVGLGMGLGVALAAFQLLPVAALLATSNRQAGLDWDFRTGSSLPPWHLLELFGPLVFGDPRQSYWPGPGYEWHERLLYVGVVPLLAAGRLRGRWRWACWGGAALAILLAFGRYLPGYALTQSLPGYGSLRIPSKHLALAALGLAVAAGVGLPYLKGRRAALWTLGLAAGLALIGCGLALWLPDAVVSFGGGDPRTLPPGRPGPGLLGLRGLLPGIVALVAAAGIMLVPAARPRHALLIALAAIELLTVLRPFRGQISDPLAIVAGVQLPPDQPRIGALGDDALAGNFGPVLHVELPGGYLPLFSGGYMQLLTGTVNPGVVLNAPRDSGPILYLLGYPVLVDRQVSRVTVFEPPPPRAWVAHCVWPGDALVVRQPDFPRSACITRTGAAGREPVQPPGPATITSEGVGRQTIEASGPGWLVTAQPWYPGWAAFSEGVALPVEQVDGALVGVRLPDGPHTVELHYRPAGFDLGLAMSGAAVLVLLVAWLADRRPRPRSGPDGLPDPAPVAGALYVMQDAG